MYNTEVSKVNGFKWVSYMSKLRKILVLSIIGLFSTGLCYKSFYNKLDKSALFGVNTLNEIQSADFDDKSVSVESIELYKREIAGKGLSVVDYYHNELKSEEEALWQEIYTSTGLNYKDTLRQKEKIDKYEKRLLSKKRKRRSKSDALSSKVKNLALEVIDDFGIEKTDLEIVSGDSTSYGQRCLIVCESQLRCMPLEGARSVLAHELIHYQFGDDAMRDAMVCLLDKKKINYKKFSADHPFYKHMRFEELRADILSALKERSYAQGALEALSVLLQDEGDKGYPSHPLTSERIRRIKQVSDFLLCEQQLNEL